MFRRRFVRRRSHRRVLWPFLLLGAVTLGFAFVERAVVPTLIAMAEAEVSGAANRLIVDMVHERVLPLVQKKELIDFTTGASGEVVFVEVNSAYLGELESLSLSALQEGLEKVGTLRVYVPLGQLLGSRILAASGPKIAVTLIPAGVVSTKITDSFQVAGINQTKYTLFLTARISMKVIVPLVASSTVVSAEVPLATVLISGKVPDTYLSLPSPSTSWPLPNTGN